MILEDTYGENLEYLQSDLFRHMNWDMMQFKDKIFAERLNIDNFSAFLEALQDTATEFSKKKYNKEEFGSDIRNIQGFLDSQLVQRIKKKIATVSPKELEAKKAKEIQKEFIDAVNSLANKYVACEYVSQKCIDLLYKTITAAKQK